MVLLHFSRLLFILVDRCILVYVCRASVFAVVNVYGVIYAVIVGHTVVVSALVIGCVIAVVYVDGIIRAIIDILAAVVLTVITVAEIGVTVAYIGSIVNNNLAVSASFTVTMTPSGRWPVPIAILAGISGSAP